MRYPAVLILSLCFLTYPAPAQDGQSTASEQDIVFFSDNGPVLFRLNVTIDGKPISAQMEPYFQAWFEKLDRDRDGALDGEEIKIAPNVLGMNNLFRTGYYYFQANASLSLTDFNKKGDEKVSLPKFQRYFQNTAMSSLQLARSFTNNATSSSTSLRLFKLFDENGDEKISAEEVASALTRIGQFDINEDDYLDNNELSLLSSSTGTTTFQVNRPVQVNNSTLPDEFFLVDSNQKRVQLTAILLAKLDTNKDLLLNRSESKLSKTAFNRLDKNRNNQLDIIELSSWLQGTTSISLNIPLGQNKAKGEKLAMVASQKQLPKTIAYSQTGNDRVQFSLKDAQITIQKSSNLVSMNGAGASQYYLQLYRSALLNKNKQVVSLADLQDVRFQFLKNAFPFIDDNRDEKIDEKEVYDFIAFLGSGKNLNVSLSVQQEGRGIFQLLDLNRDTRLSLREIMTAWTQLKTMDQNKDDFFTEGEVAKQFTMTISQGSVYSGGNARRGIHVRAPQAVQSGAYLDFSGVGLLRTWTS